MAHNSLEAIYYLAQTLAAIGVIISIFYMAAQLRRNTRAVRLVTAHNLAEEVRNSQMGMIQDAELARIFLLGFTDPDALTGVDRFRYYVVTHNILRSYENVYYQRISGAHESRHADGMHRQLIDLMHTPGFARVWLDRRHWYSDEFQTYIEREILPAGSSYRVAGS